MDPLFVAKRPFDPSIGEAWNRYLAWSGLSQLKEVVSLDTMLCPTVPEELSAEDWNHNVHADYLAFFFRSPEYLRRRVAGEGRLNLLAVLQNPTHSDLAAVVVPGFAFAGFDLVDIHTDISALTNCGGFEGVFLNAELSELGLLTDLRRAQEVQAELRVQYPEESHAECHVWAIWRQLFHAAAGTERSY
ncbi:MAG TPA: hypothetical protein VFH40_13660 [Gemmatimonadales bacterium]|nr:hypothetical protein [Gemmatimonadales bacterium]